MPHQTFPFWIPQGKRINSFRYFAGGGMSKQKEGPGHLALLGPLRFLLANLVVACHMGPNWWFQFGRHAVIAFFVISGYLVSDITRGRYRNRPVDFLRNRFLRIYPQYFFAALFGLATLLIIPGAAHAMGGEAFILPEQLLAWVHPILIYVQYSDLGGWFVPPAWSLDTEIHYYVLIGLVISARPSLLPLFFTISIPIAALSIFGKISLPFYGHFATDGVIFLSGAFAQHLKEKGRPSIWLALFGGFAMASSAALDQFALTVEWQRNVSLLATALGTALLLAALPSPRLSDSVNKLMLGVGKLSYPLFLLHMTVGTWYLAFMQNLRFHTNAFHLAVWATSLLLSLASVYLIDNPLEKLRDNIRKTISSTRAWDWLWPPLITLPVIAESFRLFCREAGITSGVLPIWGGAILATLLLLSPSLRLRVAAMKHHQRG